jgi:hypothetical protein
LYTNSSQNYYQPLALSINQDLNIFLTWGTYDEENYTYGNTLYGLLYDQSGNVISKTMNIGSYSNDYFYCLHNLDNYLTDAGDYIVAWIDNARLYTWRTFTTDKSYTFKNSIECPYNNYYPIVDIIHSENHKTFISYTYGSTIQGSYLNDNSHQVKFYRLGFNETFSTEDKSFFDATIFNSDMFFTYESNKHVGSGIDIWGNVQSLKDIDFEPERFHPPVNDDILYSNFPNPFNGTTTISYELLAYHKVKLAIYDVLGREVRVLVDQNQEKGYYEVEFNAAGLASGIYFCRLQAFRTQIRKIILIK